MPDVDAAKQAKAALKAAHHEKKMRTELSAAMHGLIANADLTRVQNSLTDEEEENLTSLAIFTATARTTVERNGYTGELLVIPQPEGPARLVKALRQLHGAMVALGVDHNTRWDVLARMSTDCAPAIRTPLMLALLANKGWAKTAAIAEAAELVPKTAARHLDDLVLLGMAERKKAERKKKTTKSPDADAAFFADADADADADGDTDAVGSPADNSPFMWQATTWLREHWPGKVRQKTTTTRVRVQKEADTPPPHTPPATPRS